MRLLIIEDEVALAQSLQRGLQGRGFAVDLAYDGEDGFEKARLNAYDVVVLDRDLPIKHGDEVCRDLIAMGTGARILMLTAASTTDDLVDGFELGADDYLGKPFEFAELVVRVNALIRRAGVPAPVLLQRGDIELDPARGEARRGDRELSLTPREFAVLELLLRADGRIVSTEELLERAWDEHADPFTTSVRVIVSRLRSKLGEPDIISTVVGKGYRLCDAD